MTPAEAAFRAVLTMQKASAMPAIQAAVREFAQPLGYDRYVLFSVSVTAEDLVDRVFWVEGQWWEDGQEVDAKAYVRHCPVTRHILEAREAFFWSKTHQAGTERYRVVRRPAGPGLHGVQVPVFGPAGLEGAMSLGGQRVSSDSEACIALVIVAEAAFRAARRLSMAPATSAARLLTAREREVLTWTAAGSRQADIAISLGLSERTVENHLRSARRRLGVATTAQAIKVAISKGELARE